MNVRKLDRAEFDRAIRCGLGAAFLHVRTHGDLEVRDQLLAACLHNYVFDKQIDESRHKWLAMMIDRSARWDIYADAVVGELKKMPEDPWDFEQLVWLAVEMFDRGHAEVSDVLLGIFDEAVVKYEGYTKIERAIVLVGGMPAFEMAARWLGSRAEGNEYEIHSLYELAGDLFNQNEVNALLEREPTDLHLRAYLTAVKTFEEISKKPHVPNEPLTLQEVFDRVNAADDFSFSHGLRRFGKVCTERERMQIYDAFLAEEKPHQQFAYLEVFLATGLPDVNDKVLELLNSEYERLQHRAFVVLEETKSPLIRARLLKLIESECEADVGRGLRLIQSNFEIGDVPMISDKLTAIEEPEQVHWVSMTLCDLVDHHPEEPWDDVLLRLYDTEPCGFCRGEILEKLIRRGAAPAQLLFEAQWDASQEVRFTARGSQLSQAFLG